MFKKIYCITTLSLLSIASFLLADIKYDIQDIGTLQTHSSHGIALNNQKNILGWYNIDGSVLGKHFFLREHDGSFYELPNKTEAGLVIDWKYLSDNGKAYGTFDENKVKTTLCSWDKQIGFAKIGVIPGKEIVAINNEGKVLIKSISETKNGKTYISPVIWENGNITKLRGLEGDLGIESEESFGFNMNNRGEVVGQSVVCLSYKNNIYKKIHATKWVDGQAIDIHNKIPKTDTSSAIGINDTGDLLFHSSIGHLSFVGADGTYRQDHFHLIKINNLGWIYSDDSIKDRSGKWVTHLGILNNQMQQDLNSIWLKSTKIVSVNDNGEILAQAITIYGESHTILLVPKAD